MLGKRFSVYSEYKPSGVDWLGDIPAHWGTRRLKYVAPPSKQRLAEKPTDLPYIGLEHVESHTGRLMLDAPVEVVDSVVNVFQSGNVLFGKLRPYLAKAVCAKFEGVSTTELIVLQPKHDSSDSSFLTYMLLCHGFIRMVNSMTFGTKMPRIDSQQLGNVVVPLPPLSEQRAIAAFLDRETAKIDALIAKKERLIELLQEKRGTIIDQVVTRGVDKATLQPSPVEWLDTYPVTWQGAPLKRWVSTKITDGPHETPELVDSGVQFISAEAIQNDRLDFSLRRGFVSPALHTLFSRKCKPKRGDILLCKSGATTGSSGWTPSSRLKNGVS